MPAYSKENEHYYTDRIRQALFVRPKAGALTVQRILEQDRQSPLHLHHDYINRLLRKIRKERASRARKKIGEEIALMEDEFEWLREETIRILVGNTEPGDKVRAIAQMWKMRLDLYNAKLDAGIFERHLGEMVVEHRITQEQKTIILQAFANYGIIQDEPRDKKLLSPEPRPGGETH